MTRLGPVVLVGDTGLAYVSDTFRLKMRPAVSQVDRGLMLKTDHKCRRL